MLQNSPLVILKPITLSITIQKIRYFNFKICTAVHSYYVIGKSPTFKNVIMLT